MAKFDNESTKTLMSSIIEGYEYDIFISYRQKDNKGDRWVSRFVDALKTELDATFKEDLSVYFDENPHDRLQETHNVSKSLEGKLKCLIFIPILSQTYCDPNSYAWQYEFLAFNKLAGEDSFGRDIKLKNGNYASRILPVRIHDLEQEDMKLFEKETGSALRAIDFVFKTASGVNRPLKNNEDHSQDNINKTFYSDQINKVAIAIKEIILGLKAEPVISVKESETKGVKLDEFKMKDGRGLHEKSAKLTKGNFISGGIVLAFLLAVAAIIVLPEIFKPNTLDKLRSSGERISVAVMPFQNMTNDTIWNVWQDGIQDILITCLSSSDELRVRQTESIKSILQSKAFSSYASITSSVASTISKKLEADVFISGNIKSAGNTVRLYAQLVDAKTEEVFKSFQIEGTNEEAKVFGLVDSLSNKITDFLIVSQLKKTLSYSSQAIVLTYSPVAYRLFMEGESYFSNRDYPSARKLFSRALEIDSNFIVAILYTSTSYGNQGFYKPAKEWCLKSYQKRDLLPVRLKLYTEWLYSTYFETPREAIISLKKIIENDDQGTMAYYILGDEYNSLNQYENAIPEYVKALEIRNNWGLKPPWVYNYTELGEAYHKTNKFREEKNLYEKAQLDFPDDPELLYRRAVLALSEGNINDANTFIEKYKSISEEDSASVSDITTDLAMIYLEGENLEKSEEYYRQALALKPEDPKIMNNLAYFLIDNDRNINEGLELADNELKTNPDNYKYLHTKGWGLFKQGKIKESYETLQKSWDLRRQNAIYNHEAFLHLEEARKAATALKSE